MTIDHLTSLRELERQYLGADRLLLTLAARTDLSTPWTRWNPHSQVHRTIATASFTSAYTHLNGWISTHNEVRDELRSQTRTAVVFAIVAIDLAEVLPELASALEQPWSQALQARTQLRRLGTGAEHTALALAPTWRLDLPALVAAADAVNRPTSSPGPHGARP